MQYKLKNFFPHATEKHHDLVSSVSWLSHDRFVSCGDDRQLLMWDITSGVTSVFFSLPSGFYPVCMQWCPSPPTSYSRQYPELLALGTSSGNLLFFKRTGRLEKNIDGHTGGICCLKWNCDGDSLATSGEDGLIKIWSRMGMLRSTLIHTDAPIYSFAWKSSNEKIAYSRGEFLIVKSLHQSISPLQWKAHDSLITEIEWAKLSQMILSGSETGQVKLWNSYGQNLLAINIQDSAISSLCWSLNEKYFSVGSYNQLNIYHKCGWLVNLERYADIGYINKIGWSLDDMHFCLASGSGSVFTYTLENLEVSWMHYQANLTHPCCIVLHDFQKGTTESIDYADDILEIFIGFNNLVTISKQTCRVHNLSSLFTPYILDLEDLGVVSSVYLGDIYFLLFDCHGTAKFYSYDGTSILNSSSFSNRSLSLSPNTFSIFQDKIAFIDHLDDKIIHISDIFTLKSNTSGIRDISATNSVLFLEFSKARSCKYHQLAFLDSKNDLYIVPSSQNILQSQVPFKLANFISQFKWHSSYPLLAAIQEGIFVVWFNPYFVTFDKDILSLTKQSFPSFDLGVNPEILEFSQNNCIVRSSDGSLLSIYISSHITTLHACIIGKQWDDCARICRHVNSQFLWGSLACNAANDGLLSVSELSCAAINSIDRVEFLTNIQLFRNSDTQNASLLAFYQRFHQAEIAFINSELFFQAIELNLRLYNWDRALSLAIQYQTHIDTCIAFRAKFMDALSLVENRKKFKQFSDVEIDWEKINVKLACEERVSVQQV